MLVIGNSIRGVCLEASIVSPTKTVKRAMPRAQTRGARESVLPVRWVIGYVIHLTDWRVVIYFYRSHKTFNSDSLAIFTSVKEFLFSLV